MSATQRTLHPRSLILDKKPLGPSTCVHARPRKNVALWVTLPKERQVKRHVLDDVFRFSSQSLVISVASSSSHAMLRTTLCTVWAPLDVPPTLALLADSEVLCLLSHPWLLFRHLRLHEAPPPLRLHLHVMLSDYLLMGWGHRRIQPRAHGVAGRLLPDNVAQHPRYSEPSSCHLSHLKVCRLRSPSALGSCFRHVPTCPGEFHLMTCLQPIRSSAPVSLHP